MKELIENWNFDKLIKDNAARQENSRKGADKVDGSAVHFDEFSNFSRCIWKLDSEA